VADAAAVGSCSDLNAPVRASTNPPKRMLKNEAMPPNNALNKPILLAPKEKLRKIKNVKPELRYILNATSQNDHRYKYSKMSFWNQSQSNLALWL
jgi:hypothetical protein